MNILKNLNKKTKNIPIHFLVSYYNYFRYLNLISQLWNKSKWEIKKILKKSNLWPSEKKKCLLLFEII